MVTRISRPECPNWSDEKKTALISQAGPRARYLRPSACAPSCRTACPTFHVHQVAHQHRLVADRPNGLSAAWPCLQWAFAAYPRPGEAGPAVFHGPIARGQALDSPGLPRPTDADEQTTSSSAFQIEGGAAPASRTAEKRLFTALTLGLGAARKSGGVKPFAAFLAREN